jgi:hypothetical protein
VSEIETDTNQQSAAVLPNQLTWWATALEAARSAGK